MSALNKVVLVTGASSGIGAAIAVLFCKEGANVVMVGRNETKLNDVFEKCAKIGKKPLVIKADLAVENEGKRIVEETVQKYGRLDVVVNNAGFAIYGTLVDGKILEGYDKTMKVNVRAPIEITVSATPHLIKSKGNIVNISSIAALIVPYTNFLAYCISKAALDQFTRGSAKELAEYGVRVNSVNPGPVVTDFFENTQFEGATWDDMAKITPLKRVSSSEEIADLVLYLSGDKAKGITGSVFVSDNGFLLNA